MKIISMRTMRARLQRINGRGRGIRAGCLLACGLASVSLFYPINSSGSGATYYFDLSLSAKSKDLWFERTTDACSFDSVNECGCSYSGDTFVCKSTGETCDDLTLVCNADKIVTYENITVGTYDNSEKSDAMINATFKLVNQKGCDGAYLEVNSSSCEDPIKGIYLPNKVTCGSFCGSCDNATISKPLEMECI